MEMKHFGHDHTLILRAEQTEEGEPIVCYACEQPIYGLSYSCRGCLYYLHVSCAQLPSQLSHPCHPHHPLTLQSATHTYTRMSYVICDMCDEDCDRFIYHCQSCNFDVDIRCANMTANIQKKIKHKCHRHELTPIENAASFLCYGCGTQHQGEFSYLCTTCGFWVSQKCANSLPASIHLSQGCQHPLFLKYSSPFQISSSFCERKHCKFCEAKGKRGSWMYYCLQEGCKYAVHVMCALPVIEHSREGIIDIDLQHLGLKFADISLSETKIDINKTEEQLQISSFPVVDNSIDIFTQFIKDSVGLRQGGKFRWDQARNVGHQHIRIRSTKVAMDDAICEGCAIPITSSDPFFSCPLEECDYILHEWCARLPNELQHPSHPEHALVLTKKDHRLPCYRCNCCGLWGDIFCYSCSECEFYLDCKCAFLPRTIRHEAHNHPLALRKIGTTCCSTCNRRRNIQFLCDICKFRICTWCAVLPRTTKHRYDKHPLILTYSPIIREFEDEGFCEVCYGRCDISTEWFYHCTECDQSFHSKCLFPVDIASNIVCINPFYTSHHHGLFLKEPPFKPPQCGQCNKLVLRHSPSALHCKPCNIWIHSECYMIKG